MISSDQQLQVADSILGQHIISMHHAVGEVLGCVLFLVNCYQKANVQCPQLMHTRLFAYVAVVSIFPTFATALQDLATAGHLTTASGKSTRCSHQCLTHWAICTAASVGRHPSTDISYIHITYDYITISHTISEP